MEKALILAVLLKRHFLAKKRAALAERRRINTMKRFRLFAAKQARERMLFALILTTAYSYTIMKPGKVLWSKERGVDFGGMRWS